MSTTPDQTEPGDLHTLLRPVWRRKWLLLAIVVLSTVGAYFVSARRPPVYRSSTQVFVSNSQVGAIVSQGAAPVGGTDRLDADQATLLLSNPVSEAVIQQLGLHATPGAVASQMSAVPVTGTDFITVTAQSGSAAEAAALANAYAQQYLHFSARQLAQQVAAAVAQLRTQIAGLPAKSAQAATLSGLIHELQVLQAAGPSARQGDPAVAAAAPVSPRPKRDALFALVISLALGVGLIFGLERFDRRITDIESVSPAYGLPLLTVIPHANTPAALTDGVASVPDTMREALRTLRTNIQLASLDRPVKRIAVTSGVAGEGKSIVVRNLALTYREFGLAVVVVEADLRRPTLSPAFGVTGDTGLTALFRGECELGDALRDVEVDFASIDYLRVGVDGGREGPEARRESGSGKLMLLASGRTPPNPQAVLASEKMQEVLALLSETFDIVIIDTPPLLVVSDALPLLAECDGVILVTRVGKTERQEAQRTAAAARLDPTVRILGVVANDVAFQAQQYSYGYSSLRG